VTVNIYSGVDSKFIRYNIENGSVVNSQSGVTTSVEDFGNGWFRCSYTRETAATGNPNTVVGLSDGSSQGYVGENKEILLWGLQLEQQSFATSYIPTSGSSVTRNAETCRDSGAAQDFNSTEGVLYFEIASLKTVGNFESIALSDGSNDNRHRFYLSDDSSEVVYQAQVSTSNQCFLKVTTSDITAFNKIALKYKQDDFALWINGTEVATDSSGNVPSLSELNFSSGNTFNNFEGKVREVRTYRTALTDSELTALTT